MTLSQTIRVVLALLGGVALAACFYLVPATTKPLFLNSLLLAATSICIAVPVASLLVFGVRSSGSGILRRGLELSLLVSLFLPLYIQVAGWEAGLGRGGWYSTLIAQRLSEPPLDGFRGAVWVHAMAAVPWLFWIFRIGLGRIPAVYLEAASLETNDWDSFCRIVLPQSVPLLIGGVLYVAVVTMSEITVTDCYQFRSYAEVIYNEFALNPSMDDLPLEFASLLLNLSVLVGLGLGFCWLVMPRFDTPLVPTKPASLRTHRWLSLTAVLIVGSLLLIPLGNLVYQAGIEVQEVGGGRERVWSPRKCVSLVASSPWTYRTELAWSAVLAQLSVLSSVTLATVWAWMSRANRVLHSIGTLLSVICFVVPGTLVGLAIIRLLNRPNSDFFAWLYDDTLAAPWLAATIKCLPFAYLIVWSGMRSIPKDVLDLAKVDGASNLTILRRVLLPLLRPSLICAALVCLAVTVGELSATILVLPLSVTTVSSRVFSLIHYGAEDQLAGLCLACVLLMSGLAWLTRSALQRWLSVAG